MHQLFEWDPQKARANAANHRVNFEYAAAVLRSADEQHRAMHTWDERSGEERCFTLAIDPTDSDKLYAIVWTERGDVSTPITRLISARSATRLEWRRYEQYLFGT